MKPVSIKRWDYGQVGLAKGNCFGAAFYFQEPFHNHEEYRPGGLLIPGACPFAEEEAKGEVFHLSQF
jgi:hypothetical protein